MEHLHSRFRCIIFDSYLIYLFLVWINDVGANIHRNIELLHSNCPPSSFGHLAGDDPVIRAGGSLASLNPRHHLPSGAAPAVALLLLLLRHRKQLRFEEIRTITTELPWPRHRSPRPGVMSANSSLLCL